MDMKQTTDGQTTKRPTTDGVETPHVVTAEARRRQRRKNWALLVVLASLSLLFYLITLVRMGNHG